MAQNKTIDEIFKKFDGKDGVTSVSISKDMMNLAAQMDSSDFKAKDLFAQIGSVRILAFEKASAEDKELFNTMVKGLSTADYKELMVVKEKDHNVKMLTRENQGKIIEFLLLATGDGNPVMISINGNIDPKMIGKLSSCAGMSGMQHLALLDHKKK